MRLFALSLGQDYYGFDSYFENPTTFLRLQYYPQQSDVLKENSYGIAPHTDYGFLTLLVQDSIGGLQVLKQGGGWIDVSPLPNGIILNTGDMLKYISGNKIISTPHRVINVSKCDRYSVPFFLEPDMHALISPINKGRDAIDKQAFEYAEYIMARIKGNYDINAADKNDRPYLSALFKGVY